MSTQSVNMTNAFVVIAIYAKKVVYSVQITPHPPPPPPSFFYAPVANYEKLYSTLLLLLPAFKL